MRPKRGFLDGARLLINLLEHEVLEAAFFRHDGVPGDALGLALDLIAVEVGDAHAMLGDDGDLAVIEEEEVARVVEERGDVTGYEVFVFAEADDDGRAVAGGYDLARLIGGDDDERKNSRQLFHRFSYGLFQVRAMAVAGVEVIFLDQVGDDFGIRLGDEPVSFGLQ